MNHQQIKNIISEEYLGGSICESLKDFYVIDKFYNILNERFLHGEPISIQELRKLLHTKVVKFEFIKLGGEVRPASGTTMMTKIPSNDDPKGVRPSSPKVATFYDLTKKAWRSVSEKSKEIVLKDDNKEEPIIVVRDKKEKEPNELVIKKPEEKKVEPIKKEEPKKEEPQSKTEPANVVKPITKDEKEIEADLTNIK